MDAQGKVVRLACLGKWKWTTGMTHETKSDYTLREKRLEAVMKMPVYWTNVHVGWPMLASDQQDGTGKSLGSEQKGEL